MLPGFVSLRGLVFSPRPVVVKLPLRSPLSGTCDSFHSDDVGNLNTIVLTFTSLPTLVLLLPSTKPPRHEYTLNDTSDCADYLHSASPSRFGYIPHNTSAVYVLLACPPVLPASFSDLEFVICNLFCFALTNSSCTLICYMQLPAHFAD